MTVADTRLNLRFRDGQEGFNDEGDKPIEYPDGRVLSVRTNYRKLRLVKDGWAAAAGAFPLVHAALEHLDTSVFDPDSLTPTLDALYEQEAPRIRSDFPEMTKLEETAVVLTYYKDGSFRLACHRFDHTPAVSDGDEFLLIDPPGFDATIRHRIVGAIQAGLVIGTSRSALCSNLRLLAGAFHIVHSNSSSVSDTVEVGLLLNDGRIQKKYLYARNEFVMNATDKDLITRLVALGG